MRMFHRLWFFFSIIVSTIVSGLYQRVVKNEGEVDSKCPLIEGIPYGGTDFNDYTPGNRYSYTILIDRRNCRILDLIWFENFVNNKLRLDQELPIGGLRRFGIHSFLDGGRINHVSIIR